MTKFQKLVQKKSIRLKQDCVRQILSDLAAFNLLNKQKVDIIAGASQIDAVKICEKHGITYETP